MLKYEHQIKAEGFDLIIGIDEAGRGPLAGPVVASAVSLKHTDFSNKISDSKKMTPKQRQAAYHEIYDKAYVGVGIISESVIDEHNILNATFLAMRNAVDDLMFQFGQAIAPNKVCLLVDGNQFKVDVPYQYRTIVGGDSLVFSIACASVIAKVTRDRILEVYDQVFPEYGFKKHKGYPTRAHREAIKEYGASTIHRQSYRLI